MSIHKDTVMKKWNTLVFESMRLPVPPVLVRVISQQGSAPRTAGARMLVREHDILGTIGGGQYEGQAIAISKQLQNDYLRSVSGTTIDGKGGKCKEHVGKNTANRAGVMRFSLYGVDDMDMVCGGELCLLFELLLPDSDSCEVFFQGAQAESGYRDFCLISMFEALDLPKGGPCISVDDFLGSLAQGVFVPVQINTVFLGSGDTQVTGISGPSLFSPFIEEAGAFREPGFAHLATGDENAFTEGGGNPYCFVDPFPAPHVVHIFGGGHVSKALADCLASLSFGIVVLEDREEFIGHERFPLAQSILLPSLGYESSREYLVSASPTEHHAIVIMTRGHAYDRDVLAAALESEAGYVGMIGSKRKWGEVQRQLVASGVSQAVLDMVHTPIGLAIGAETPEEIGVSIAAELIAWRSGAGTAV